MNLALERCRQEIAAVQDQKPKTPAWLTTLGQCDWIWELELLGGTYAFEAGEEREGSESEHQGTGELRTPAETSGGNCHANGGQA